MYEEIASHTHFPFQVGSKSQQDGNSSNGPAAKLSTLPTAYWIPIIMTKRMADDQHQKADLSEAAKLLLLLWSYAPKNFGAQD